MKDVTYNQFRQIIYDVSGIALNENKQGMLISRISKRMRELNLSTEEHYLEYLKKPSNAGEIVSFIDCVSTNVTSFYREKNHFEILKRYAHYKVSKGCQNIKVWCAASSSGEEPYTIAMTLAECLERRQCSFKILATDISTRVLDLAVCGEYSEERIRPISPNLLKKYFSIHRTGNEDRYQVCQELRERILFKRLNLIKHPLPLNGGIDVIFCRNVLIYFDAPTKQKILCEFERLLSPGGILFISHTESFTGLTHHLTIQSPSVYVKSKELIEALHD